MKSPAKVFLLYYIGYVMIKDSKYLKINRVNPLYLITNKLNEYFEEINKTKHLMKNSDFDAKYMKIKFNLLSELV